MRVRRLLFLRRGALVAGLPVSDCRSVTRRGRSLRFCLAAQPVVPARRRSAQVVLSWAVAQLRSWLELHQPQARDAQLSAELGPEGKIPERVPILRGRYSVRLNR